MQKKPAAPPPGQRALNGTPWELAVLLAVFVLIGYALVPVRIDNMWWDPEFTGWVAPFMKRLAAGQLLYADGGHMPVPPLSFLLMYWIFGAKAIWIDESLLNFLFQCGLVVMGYLALSRWLPRPIPFLAALAGAGFYFAFTKSIFYDSLAQFIAAAGLLCASRAFFSVSERQPAKVSFFALGSCLAALMLTKQTTAFGLAAGSVAAILFLKPEQGRPARAVWFSWLGMGFVTALVPLCLVITPWVDWRGLVQDVFVTSAEPKKDVINLRNIFWFSYVYLLSVAVFGVLPLAVCFMYLRRKAATQRFSLSVPERLRWIGPGLALLAVVICVEVPRRLMPDYFMVNRHSGSYDFTRGFFIPMSFALLSGLILLPILGRRGKLAKFGGLCTVAMAAAVAHSLSSPTSIRLCYDNNPVVMFAIASLLAAGNFFFNAIQLPPRARTAAMAAGCFAAVFCGWIPMIGQMQRVDGAMAAWPEVPYLQGAKMREDAQGLRSLAALVRREAGPLDSVLLLPEDPDLAAWWDRPRPPLSGAVIFTDQYWNRYVDEDYHRLEQAPPKLVIIGPRNAWRIFSGKFGGADGVLIDRLKQGLLRQRYRLLEAHPITFRHFPDFMDVYERIDGKKGPIKNPRGARD